MKPHAAWALGWKMSMAPRPQVVLPTFRPLRTQRTALVAIPWTPTASNPTRKPTRNDRRTMASNATRFTLTGG